MDSAADTIHVNVEYFTGFEEGDEDIKRILADGTSVEEIQTVNIPVHGSKLFGSGLLKRLYRNAIMYLSEDNLQSYFYTD